MWWVCTGPNNFDLKECLREYAQFWQPGQDSTYMASRPLAITCSIGSSPGRSMFSPELRFNHVSQWLMSLIIAAVYVLASLKWHALLERPEALGALYGVGIFPQGNESRLTRHRPQYLHEISGVHGGALATPFDGALSFRRVGELAHEIEGEKQALNRSGSSRFITERNQSTQGMPW
jgi:hypothetical protein